MNSDSKTPDLTKIRRTLFWDTRFDLIDWEHHKRAVIERVFQRGNDQEKDEITRFYGEGTIHEVLNKR